MEEGRVEERKREERVDGPTLDKLMGQVLETMAASGKGKVPPFLSFFSFFSLMSLVLLLIFLFSSQQTYEIFGALPFTEMDRRLFASGCLRLSGEVCQRSWISGREEI